MKPDLFFTLEDCCIAWSDGTVIAIYIVQYSYHGIVGKILQCSTKELYFRSTVYTDIIKICRIILLFNRLIAIHFFTYTIPTNASGKSASCYQMEVLVASICCNLQQHIS